MLIKAPQSGFYDPKGILGESIGLWLKPINFKGRRSFLPPPLVQLTKTKMFCLPKVSFLLLSHWVRGHRKRAASLVPPSLTTMLKRPGLLGGVAGRRRAELEMLSVSELVAI